MKKKEKLLQGNFNAVNRRRFILAGCAACAGAAVPKMMRPAESRGKMRIRVVYALSAVKQATPDWPNLGFDFAPVMEKINNTLANAFPEMEFLPVTSIGPLGANNPLFRDSLSHIDGYIIYQMNSAAWNLVPESIAATGKPILFTRFQYGGTGGFLVHNAIFLHSHSRNVGFVASSNLDDLLAAVKCFRDVKAGGSASDFGAAVARVRKERTPGPGDLSCIPDPVTANSAEECLRQVKQSKILAVGYPGVSLMGVIPSRKLLFGELNKSYQAADKDEARAVATQWQEAAQSVEGVSSETLERSAAMYLGMKDLLKKYQADAITINCLVGFYGGMIPAYPCLGFHQLCNDGLVGACECDVRSAATMIMVSALTRGRPGYISDPELDTSKRRIIYTHCVASNRPFGPQGPANPFQILTHSEDRKGASVRSLLPSGYITTTLEFSPERKQILFHQAKTVGNDPDDRACRTKLVAEPMGDCEKLFSMWDKWGWHRVTVYGDLKEPVFALADAMGYEVVLEA